MAPGPVLIASGNAVAPWFGVVVTAMTAFATYAATTLEGHVLLREDLQLGSGGALRFGSASGAGLAAIVGLVAAVRPVSVVLWLLTGVAPAATSFSVAVRPRRCSCAVRRPRQFATLRIRRLSVPL